MQTLLPLATATQDEGSNGRLASRQRLVFPCEELNEGFVATILCAAFNSCRLMWTQPTAQMCENVLDRHVNSYLGRFRPGWSYNDALLSPGFSEHLLGQRQGVYFNLERKEVCFAPGWSAEAAERVLRVARGHAPWGGEKMSLFGKITMWIFLVVIFSWLIWKMSQ